jgi:hypothetical protein
MNFVTKLQSLSNYIYLYQNILFMGNKMQLTSVKIPEDLFEQFKIACVKYKFSVQKLTERGMFLYLTNEDFRKQLHNTLDTQFTGSI